jgi:hypothetical protein
MAFRLELGESDPVTFVEKLVTSLGHHLRCRFPVSRFIVAVSAGCGDGTGGCVMSPPVYYDSKDNMLTHYDLRMASERVTATLEAGRSSRGRVKAAPCRVIDIAPAPLLGCSSE